ncbi:hypothetical protein BV22DRAFT_1135655 [Leucogyrophana mollusca]|uniref:Uncharacterized protein n=1 Tax=Leucogyrophana mollusca TaxID=85980 RepID=A0ACB8AV66_9AGAM|nr:hypothetical protein BV22DRAFT_1135655 [Leucogyrophana mollusca]
MITALVLVLAYFGCTTSASTIVAFVALIFQACERARLDSARISDANHGVLFLFQVVCIHDYCDVAYGYSKWTQEMSRFLVLTYRSFSVRCQLFMLVQ